MMARRDVAAFAARAVAARTVLPLAARAEGNPDADLIGACAQHIVNHHAYNTAPSSPGLDDLEDDPLWLAYEQTRNLIDAAKPTTVAGLQAKARAAKAEALRPGHGECADGGPSQAWAWDLVNDLLALNGAA